MSQFTWLTPVEEAQVASRRGDTATKPKVSKETKGTTLEVDDLSELAMFAKCINQEQSALTGLGRWVVDGRLRLLAKELGDLADAADEAGVQQFEWKQRGEGSARVLERLAAQHEAQGDMDTAADLRNQAAQIRQRHR